MRQAISPLISSMILIASGLFMGGVLFVTVMNTTNEDFSCSITNVELIEITTDQYWLTVTIFNDGDYDIETYSIYLYEGNQKTEILSDASALVHTDASIESETVVNQLITEDTVIIGVRITNLENSSECLEQVTI